MNVGQHLMLKNSTADQLDEKHGTVVRLYHKGGFRVAFDSFWALTKHGWKKIPGGRYDYPASSADFFMVKL